MKTPRASARRTYDRETSVVPADGLPCVWMSAGLLAWRLCDLEYDCEHCPLDAVLGGEHPLTWSDGPEADARRLAFPDDRTYSSSHGWILPLRKGYVRLGLDMLVTRLLDQISGVVLPAVGSPVRSGQPLCWLVDAGVPVPVTCPVSGVVERGNPDVQADPRLLSASPYDRGWLVDLATDDDLEGRPNLGDAAEQRELAARRLQGLRRERALRAKRTRRAVGATACDGGLPVRGLRRMIGTTAYHGLVQRILE